MCYLMLRRRLCSSVCTVSVFYICVFFFQAEDGIRDWSVTGVQTCALPILDMAGADPSTWTPREVALPASDAYWGPDNPFGTRSEERRVGKEWRSGWWPDH